MAVQFHKNHWYDAELDPIWDTHLKSLHHFNAKNGIHVGTTSDAIAVCLLQQAHIDLAHNASESLIKALQKTLDLKLDPSLETAGSKRQIEHLYGRFAAKQAMTLLCRPDRPRTTKHPINMAETLHVGVGENRCPQFTPPFVGSVSHTKSLAAAIVTDLPDVQSLGIDIEGMVKIDKALKLAHKVLTPAEIKWLSLSSFAEDLSADSEKAQRFCEIFTCLFAAKEAIYKALYPVVKSYFGFQAASSAITLQHFKPASGTLQFSLTEALHDQLPIGTVIQVHYEMIQCDAEVYYLAYCCR